MAYTPITRGDEPLAPIYLTFRGTDNLWDIMKDVSLNTGVPTPYSYETQLQEFITWITNYVTNVDVFHNIVLIGHSLGAKYALDVTFELIQRSVQTQRLQGCIGFNGFYTVDDRWMKMFGVMNNKRDRDDENTEHARSLMRSIITSHIVHGDFASKNMLATPIGNVYVYGTNSEYPSEVLLNESWRTLTLSQYLVNTQHSIDNYTQSNPTEIQSGFKYIEGQEFVVSTSDKELFPQYPNSNGVAHSLELLSPNEALANTSDVRYLTSLEVNSANEAQHCKWIATQDEQDLQYFSVNFMSGQVYLNVPVTLTSGLNAYTVRVHPTPTTGEFLIEELYSTQAWVRAWSAPSEVWYLSNSGRMPLAIETSVTYSLPDLAFNPKFRWKFFNFVDIDPGHRRVIEPDPMWQLKANGNTHFVIQQPDVPDYYMEQQDRPDAADDYAAIILKGSVAQTSNNTGISWRAIYNATSDTYEFRNWKNTNVSIGFYNIWYVTGAGNTNMNINSNVDVKLTSTGETDEY